MRKLYHFELCPFSRQIRILLHEKHIEFNLVSEKYWLNSEHFLKINPAGTTPVLIDEKLTVVDAYPILDYIEEIYPETPLIGRDIKEKNENRRLISWFNQKFAREITTPILSEKVISYYIQNQAPKSEIIRTAKNNLYKHLDYMTGLLEQRDWLGGDSFSMADIVAASHISVLDFLNDIPWQKSRVIKDWYSLVKSRPSFRDLITDYVQGFNPPPHYGDLDF